MRDADRRPRRRRDDTDDRLRVQGETTHRHTGTTQGLRHTGHRAPTSGQYGPMRRLRTGGSVGWVCNPQTQREATYLYSDGGMGVLRGPERRLLRARRMARMSSRIRLRRLSRPSETPTRPTQAHTQGPGQGCVPPQAGGGVPHVGPRRLIRDFSWPSGTRDVDVCRFRPLTCAGRSTETRNRPPSDPGHPPDSPPDHKLKPWGVQGCLWLRVQTAGGDLPPRTTRSPGVRGGAFAEPSGSCRPPYRGGAA